MVSNHDPAPTFVGTGVGVGVAVGAGGGVGTAVAVGAGSGVGTAVAVGAGTAVAVGSRGVLEQASTKPTTTIDRTIRNLNLFLNRRTSICLLL